MNIASTDRAALFRECGLPDNARFILCAGAIEKDHGFREAIWTFDILKYVYPDLWLLIAGDGPARADMEAFNRSRSREGNRVRILGVRRDVPQLLHEAELVWICGRRGGRSLAVEALAAGRPVVARRRQDLLELLGDGETGFLIASGLASDYALASRRILDNPTLRSRLGEAARNRARCFALPRILEQWVDLYADIIPPARCNPGLLLSI